MTYANPVQKIVAVAYDEHGEYFDAIYGWETGQNMALHEGVKVFATADDGHMSRADAQTLYDAELRRHRDCYGEESGHDCKHH